LTYDVINITSTFPYQVSDNFIKWNVRTNVVQTIGRFVNFVNVSERTDQSDLPFFFALPCNVYVQPGQAADWSHGNSFTATSKYYVYSARSLSAIYIFDNELKQLLYKVGGPASDFTFSDRGDVFSTQHAVSIVYEDALSANSIFLILFDNANDDTISLSPRSRGLKLHLDLKMMTASAIFKTYNPLNATCISNFTGSIYQSPHGGYLLNFPTCDWQGIPPQNAYIYKLNAQGVVQYGWTYVIPNQYYNYRMYEIPYIVGEQVIQFNN